MRLMPLEVKEGPDPPDVLVRLPDMTLAIEVTEYHSSQKRRQAEEAWRDIVKASRPLREQHPEMDRLSVHLEFRKQQVPETAQIGSFVDEVIKFCLSHLYQVSDEDLYLYAGPDRYPLLADFTKRLILYDVGGPIDWHSNLDSGFVGLTEEELLKAVEKKALAAQRPEDINEFWLVVFGGVLISQVVGFISEEDLQEFAKVNSALAASAFDAVYLRDAQIARWTPDPGWKIVREWGDQGN